MITQLTTVLNQIESTFGKQTCIDHCESIYSDLYRSKETCTAKDEPELQSDMIEMVMQYLGTKAGVYQVPDLNDDYYDYFDHDSNNEVLQQFKQQATDLVASGIEFVYMCNYKGEGEGFALLEQVKHNRIYVSKFNYI